MPLWANANRNAQPTLDVDTAKVSDTITQDSANGGHWRRQKRQINTGEHSTSSAISHSTLLITTTTLVTSGSTVIPQVEVIVTTAISSDVNPFAQPSRGSLNSSSTPTPAPATSSNSESQSEVTPSNTERVSSFFMNKGAVAGVFTMLCILLFALCFVLSLTLIRQRRRRERMLRRSSMGQGDILPQALYKEDPTNRRSYPYGKDKLGYEPDDRRQSRRGAANLPPPNSSRNSVVRTMTFAVPPDNVSGIYQGEPSPVVAHPERSYTRGAGWKRPYDDRLWSVTRHSAPTPEPIRYSISSPYAYPYYNYDNARDYDNDEGDEKAVMNQDDNQSPRARSRPYSHPSGIAPPRTPSKKKSRSLRRISLATPKTTMTGNEEEENEVEGRSDKRREGAEDESQKWFRFTRRGKRKPVPITADELDDDEKVDVHHEENASSLQTGRAVEADPTASRAKENRNGTRKWNDLFAAPARDTKEGSDRHSRSDRSARSRGADSGVRVSIMPFDSNSSGLPIQTPPVSTYTSRWFIRRSQSGKSGLTAGDSVDDKRRSGSGSGSGGASGNSSASARAKRISHNSRISEQSKVEEEDEEETQSFTLEDALMSSLGRGITQENVGMGAAEEVEKEQAVETERKRMIRNSSGSYLVNARGWRATQTGGLPSPLTREGGEGEDDIRLTEAATDVRRATSSATGQTGERRGNGDLLRVKSDGSRSGKHPYASTREIIPTHPLRRGE